ncbi:hypothetical protein PVMG_04882 [Plasmodium vivax Mauritania I]|uniref:PIR Superfamily Protein n=1 Tax=Plasmodium vivax Mauritania I TaxID=1035515 RepID=A0A0J9T6L9_PLAVI|nr:hypothetical protein PVMG_04882 [Plasmodium vivax Mauritania I]
MKKLFVLNNKFISKNIKYMKKNIIIKIYVLRRKNIYSDFRNALWSYTKYEILNNPVEVNGENLICEDLSSKLRMHKSFKKFCYMLSKNIKSVCKPLGGIQISEENCEFLNYWLYDALIKIKFLNDETNILESPLIEYISELWNASNCNNNCVFKKYSSSTKDLNILKELYDYSKNYSFIESNQQFHKDVQCQNQYCSYIKKVNNVYELAKSACDPKNDKAYCQILGTIPGDKIPQVFLDGYQCSNEEMNEDHIKDDKIFTNPLLASAFEDPDYTSDGQHTVDSLPQPIGDQRQNSSEGSSSNSPVKVGLSLTGISFFPLLLIYKVTLNAYLHK